MKFGLSFILATLGFAITLFSGASAVATGSEIDIVDIVKALEARNVPADIIKAVNIKLMARNDPIPTVTVTSCAAPGVPATSAPAPAPPASTPVEAPAAPPTSAPAPPPITSAGTPPAETPAPTPPVETLATPPPTSEGQPPATSAPPATEATGPIPTPDSSTGSSGAPPSTTDTLTQTTTEASSTETTFVGTPIGSQPAASSSEAPAAPNAAGIAKMDVVAIGFAALAVLF